MEYKKDPTKGDILYTWFPNEAYVETPMEIAAVDPRKTCLEKAFLLHKEFMKTDMNKIRIERMSRHLYDLYRLDKSGVADAALHDRELYAAIIEHRMQFSRLRMLFKGKTNRWILRFTDSRQLTPENE